MSPPLTPGFVHAEPDDLEGLKQIVRENRVAGILIECVQGEGGVRALSDAVDMKTEQQRVYVRNRVG